MEDILIHARRDRVIITGLTQEGREWMRKNYGNMFTSIPADTLSDFKKDLTELKLTYEDS